MSRKRIEDEFTQLKISRQRKYQLRKQRDKRCTKCGKPAVQATLCVEHLVLTREKRRRKLGLEGRYSKSLSYQLQQGD